MPTTSSAVDAGEHNAGCLVYRQWLVWQHGAAISPRPNASQSDGENQTLVFTFVWTTSHERAMGRIVPFEFQVVLLRLVSLDPPDETDVCCEHQVHEQAGSLQICIRLKISGAQVYVHPPRRVSPAECD